MEADAINEAQLQRQRMLRSQGPLNPTDTTHLNPVDCYIRSYDCHQQCNINASYNTVSLPIKEKRRKLVITISTLLGHYSGDWYAPSLKPRNLPLHPLDWSTTLLRRLCGFAQSLPRDITVEQRLHVAHRTMLDAVGHPPGPDNSVSPPNMGDADQPTHTGTDHNELEQLRADNRRLVDRVQGMIEELETSDLIHAIETSFGEDHLEEAEAALTTCKRELEESSRRHSYFEGLHSKEELQAINDRYEKLTSSARSFLGFA